MEFVSNDINGIPSLKDLSWSYFSPTLGVILSDYSVHFFSDSGSDTIYASVSRNSQATVIEWSENCDSLAIGWQDGIISVWTNGRVSHSSFSLEGPITLIKWHPTLPILLCASDNKFVATVDCTAQPHAFFKSNHNYTFSQAIWTQNDSLCAVLTTDKGEMFSFENYKDKFLTQIHLFPVPVKSMTATAGKLVVITSDNLMSIFSVMPSITKLSQTKLSAGEMSNMIELLNDVICYAINDQITVAKVSSDDSVILRAPRDEIITSLHFSTIDAALYAITQSGKLLIFRSTMKGLVNRAGWEQMEVVDLYNRVEKAFWSPFSTAFVSITLGKKPTLFRRIELRAVAVKDTIVWQPDSKTLSVNDERVKLPSVVEDIHRNGPYILASTLTQGIVFTLRGTQLTPLTDPFSTKSPFLGICNENTYECSQRQIIVRNLQGVVKQTVTINTEYPIIKFASNGTYLCAVADDHSVFVYDVSRRAPRLVSTTQLVAPYDDYRINDIQISCGGFCIAASIDRFENGHWYQDESLILHSPQLDKTIQCAFDGRVPLHARWDDDDPRLLCVEAAPRTLSFESGISGRNIHPLFVSDSLDVYRQPPLPLEASLLAVSVPNVLAASRGRPELKVLPQFEGLDTADEDSKRALMELNFHLAAGDVDAAFNALRGVSNRATWRSLAQTCAQRQRTDLVDVCLGSIEDAPSAIMLRKLKEWGDTSDLAVLVNTQLCSYDEALRFARESRRFDLVSSTYRALGNWKDAISVAKSDDRIRFKRIAFQYGRHLELAGDYEKAVEMYEAAGAVSELPRLAIQKDDVKLLFELVAEAKNVQKPILIWLGRFFEAHNQIDAALDMYQRGDDPCAYVRLLCIDSRWDEAKKYAQKSGRRSVLCCLARLIEKRAAFAEEKGEDASQHKRDVVELFRRARQFGQALLFALSSGMTDDVLSLSFSAPPHLVCRAAHLFERNRDLKSAILLYDRAGRQNRALQLCFKHKQYDALDEIADRLSAKTDRQILLVCGRHFTESQRWSKAATCFALAGQFDTVIDLCDRHNVKLPSHVIQELAELETSDRAVMERFAALCEQQQDFLTASKLYLKLKDHISSLKVLIRAGDTAKVIKFAKLFRKRETFILAANYLQTLRPREPDQIFNTVVDFYRRANAPDKLARFFESSSQVEIDEHQEYENGLDLLRRALEIIEQLDGLRNKDAIISSMRMKGKLIAIFIQARRIVNDEPKKAIAMCVELLRTKEIESCLKSDDVYILMVRAYKAQGNYKNAYKILDDLHNSGTELTWFMDVEEIEEIYKNAGQKYEGPKENHTANEDQFDEIIDEDIDIE